MGRGAERGDTGRTPPHFGKEEGSLAPLPGGSRVRTPRTGSSSAAARPESGTRARCGPAGAGGRLKTDRKWVRRVFGSRRIGKRWLSLPRSLGAAPARRRRVPRRRAAASLSRTVSSAQGPGGRRPRPAPLPRDVPNGAGPGAQGERREPGSAAAQAEIRLALHPRPCPSVVGLGSASPRGHSCPLSQFLAVETQVISLSGESIWRSGYCREKN